MSGTGNRRADRIANAIYKCPAAFRQFHSSQCICRLATLGDCYHHILPVNHRITVAEFGSILHFHRYAAKISFHIDTSAHAITNTIGLFENLFQHKVRISPFFQLTEVEFHLLYFRYHFDIVQVDYLQLLPQIQNSYFPGFQINHFISIFYNLIKNRNRISTNYLP